MKIKSLLLAAMLFAGASMMVSCGGNATEETKSEPITVDSLAIVGESIVGDTIEVTGLCTHLCSHGGTKAFLQGEDSTIVIRCNAGEAFGAFAPDCVDQTLVVKGVVKESRIGQEEISQMEAKLAEANAECDKKGHSCDTEQAAQGMNPAADQAAKIADLKDKIAKRLEKDGKDYLSIIYIDAIEYSKK